MATKAFQKIYTKISQITKATCSLKATGVGYDELATVNGKLAQVVKIMGDEVTLQVFQGTEGIPTNAEVVYRYLTQNTEFNEAHMAVEDADIECEILAKVFKKVKPKDMTMGIIYFPFRILGRADM